GRASREQPARHRESARLGRTAGGGPPRVGRRMHGVCTLEHSPKQFVAAATGPTVGPDAARRDLVRAAAGARGHARRRSAWCGRAAAVFLAVAPVSAWADDTRLAEKRWEPGLLPAANYDTDIGLGFGIIGTLARFERGFDPYRFRAQAQLFASANVDDA